MLNFFVPCRLGFGTQGIRLNLNQKIRMNERFYLKHRGSGRMICKKLAMSATKILPFGNICNKHASSNDVFATQPERDERFFNDLKRFLCLQIGVAWREWLALFIDCDGTADGY